MDDFNAVLKAAKEAADRVVQLDERVVELAGDVQALKELAETRKVLADKLGPSGADDFANEISKFFCQVYKEAKAGGPGAVQKDAYATNVDAAAGYLIPTELMPGIIELADNYGRVMQLITPLTVAPGQTVAVNAEATRPQVTWRTDATGASNEGADITATDHDLEQFTLAPVLIGATFRVNNELLDTVSMQFGYYVVRRIVRDIVNKTETAILGASSPALAGDAPTAGLRFSSRVTERSSELSNTTSVAQILTFIADAIDAKPGLENNPDAVLFMPYSRYFDLIALGTAQAVPAVNVFGDGVLPQRMFGMRVIPHSALKATGGNGDCIVMADMSGLLFIDSRTISVGMNPYGEGWSKNQTDVRVFTHRNYQVADKGAFYRANFATS